MFSILLSGASDRRPRFVAEQPPYNADASTPVPYRQPGLITKRKAHMLDARQERAARASHTPKLNAPPEPQRGKSPHGNDEQRDSLHTCAARARNVFLRYRREERRAIQGDRTTRPSTAATDLFSVLRDATASHAHIHQHDFLPLFSLLCT